MPECFSWKVAPSAAVEGTVTWIWTMRRNWALVSVTVLYETIQLHSFTLLGT